MTVDIKLDLPPFSDEFVDSFLQITKDVFSGETSEWYESRRWRLLNMPDVSCFSMYKEGKIIAYKAGYATTYNLYYSWLGGVHPDFRKQGYAKDCMVRQHKWLQETRFNQVETHVAQDNKVMINLNQQCGLEITGLYTSEGKPYFIMRKKIET